ncbi:uncharacterized protein KY384_006452 [Bacidia gigantensis]|uniref:uncharacterized protein n=1 Tax=Bacidia gigantensis TaxID=2732470 RepID=UPI001D04AC52|nr:uncharacterized protein KY384_006452 [Bacidia gigantensis]KAG8528764.1 hypothetical protein KY384_006452 [Bacidia gigantensis]
MAGREQPYDPYIPSGSNGQTGGQHEGGNARTAAIQSQIDDTVNVMKKNLESVAQRGEHIDQLQDKSENLNQSAQGFRRGANRVRKQMWWKNMKMRIWIIVGIIVLLLIIIIPSAVDSADYPSGQHESLPSMDSDALNLASMGYDPTLRRNYSVISVLAVGFSLTNSWWGISGALVTGINSGGPVLFIYGIMLICLISICVGISLSELASAMPNAGGQYFWASELAPRGWADLTSYLTGWFAWAGAIFTSSSVALGTASAIVGCWQLSHPDFTHECPSLAFIVGLINCNYSFACLDCACHLAEELPKPERAIPVAILGTVAIGFFTSWFYVISLFYSLNDLDKVTGTSTLVPLLELFYQALGNKAGAIVLEALVVATGIWCLVASHTWQSRLCWSFARDGGIPLPSLWARVETGRGDVPLAAHSLSCFLVGALGLLYLGSSTAFNSIVTAVVVLLYVSYAIPVICLLVKGRDNIRHGPFWLGKVGLLSNIVLLVWTLFTIVMYSFPFARPVEASIYAVVVLILTIDWFARGRRNYRGQTRRHEDAAAKVPIEEEIGAAKQ